MFGTTGDIIEISAKQKPDFSFIKAANAFRAIELHAEKLINQPTKQKLWSIRQDSGIYKRSVNVLSESYKMFLDMGYRASPNMLQTLFLTQPGERQHPVNIDQVTAVARDCVLAYVECHLLAEIHHVVSAQFPITIMEVIQFRREYIGSVDACVRELVYRKGQY